MIDSFANLMYIIFEMKYISGILRAHISKAKSAFEFFGGGFMGFIGAFGLQIIELFRVYLFVLMAWLLLNWFKEMVGEKILSEFLEIWTNSESLATMLSGCLALMAAFITVFFLHRQITQSDRQHKDLLHRQHEAAKATSGITLVTISDYLRETIMQLDSILSPENKNLSIKDQLNERSLSKFPDSAIDMIRSLIETSPNENITKAFSKLANKLQLVITRLNKIRPINIGVKTVLKHEDIVSNLVYCVFVYMLVGKFYAYSRGKNLEIVQKVEDFFDLNFDKLKISNVEILEIKRGVEHYWYEFESVHIDTTYHFLNSKIYKYSETPLV